MATPVLDPSGFGEHLRALRERRGLSQPVLAGRTAISQRKISDIEAGTREARFSAREWLALSEALGVSLHQTMGIEEPTARVEPIARVAEDLTDSDIEALTITARQLASARAAAMPARDDIPGWDQMTPQEQRAYEEAEALVRRMSRLRVAEPSAPYGAGAKRGSGGRAGGGRSPGGAARAQV